MKKIIYTLLFTVLALSFMGCPSVHTDLEPLIDASVLKVRGTIQPEAWSGSGEALKSDGNGSFIYEFVATSDSANFAIDDGGWGTTYRGDADGKLLELEVGKAVKAYPLSSPDCPKLTGLSVKTKYTVKVTPYSSYVEIEVVEGEPTVPALYVLDLYNGAVKMEYDGTQYKYTAKATSDTIELPVWTSEKYLKGTYALGAENAADLTIEDKVSTVDITGVTSGSEYFVYITYDEETEKATVKAEKGLQKLYMIGDLTGWNFTELATTDGVIYTAKVKTTSDKSAFCITDKADWAGATTYRGVDGKLANIEVGTEITLENFNSGDCAPISGLKADTEYFITVKYDAENSRVTLQFSETKPLWIVGTVTSWSFNLMSMKNGNYTFDFKASEADNICITDGPSWDTNTYRKQSDKATLAAWALGTDVSFYAGNDANCPAFTGTKDSEYTITASYNVKDDVVKAKIAAK